MGISTHANSDFWLLTLRPVAKEMEIHRSVRLRPQVAGVGQQACGGGVRAAGWDAGEEDGGAVVEEAGGVWPPEMADWRGRR